MAGPPFHSLPRPIVGLNEAQAIHQYTRNRPEFVARLVKAWGISIRLYFQTHLGMNTFWGSPQPECMWQCRIQGRAERCVMRVRHTRWRSVNGELIDLLLHTSYIKLFIVGPVLEPVRIYLFSCDFKLRKVTLAGVFPGWVAGLFPYPATRACRLNNTVVNSRRTAFSRESHVTLESVFPTLQHSLLTQRHFLLIQSDTHSSVLLVWFVASCSDGVCCAASTRVFVLKDCYSM